MQLLLIYDRPTATEIFHLSTVQSRNCSQEIKILNSDENKQASKDYCKHTYMYTMSPLWESGKNSCESGFNLVVESTTKNCVEFPKIMC